MIYSDQAVVIHVSKKKEHDLNITLFTLKNGKIFAWAKGASKITSSRLGALQPGNIVDLKLEQNNNSYWLSQAQVTYSFLLHKKSTTQASLLFYLLEFCYYILPQQQSSSVTYQEIVKAIVSIEDNKVGAFIRHELNIINSLGYGPPQSIINALTLGNFKHAHQGLKQYIESILERKLESQKLFV